MNVKLRTLLWLAMVIGFCGCAHKSYHPWLGEDLLVNDDRLAGVWQGDLDVNENTHAKPDKDIVIIRAVAEVPFNEENKDSHEIPAGYYSVILLKSESLENEATIEQPFAIPEYLAGGLYKVEDTYIAQIWGHAGQAQTPLLEPMYVIYRLEYENDELRLYNLSLDGPQADEIPLTNLMVEEGKDGPHVFFSKTEDLTEFVTKYHQHKSFFEEPPRVILKRIRDLRTPFIDLDLNIPAGEELDPVH